MALILGIDPGSRVTGYGIINSLTNKLEFIDCGCIRTDSDSHPERLKEIFNGLCEIIEAHTPQQAAIEEVFMGRNPDAALKLGQARGSAIAACAHHDLPIEEYSAKKIKQAIVGTGAADKQQVQYMVKKLLSLGAKTIPEDAADALAVAICHANTHSSLTRMAGAKPFSRRRLRR